MKKVDIGAVPFKTPDGQPVHDLPAAPSFVIPVGAKNKDAACSWMLDLTSDEAWMAAGKARSETLAKTPGSINTAPFTGSPSADKKIRDTFVKSSGNAGFDKTIATYYGILDSGKSYGASPAGQAIQTALTNAITSVMLGQKSADAALKDAQDKAERAYTQFHPAVATAITGGPPPGGPPVAGARRLRPRAVVVASRGTHAYRATPHLPRDGRAQAEVREAVRGGEGTGRRSALSALGGDALDEVPLTEGEQDQHRDSVTSSAATITYW